MFLVAIKVPDKEEIPVSFEVPSELKVCLFHLKYQYIDRRAAFLNSCDIRRGYYIHRQARHEDNQFQDVYMRI